MVMRKEQDADRETDMKFQEIRDILDEIEALGPWLKGTILEGKFNKYTKKDGSVSTYKTSSILQYSVGPGERKSLRVTPEREPAIIEMLKSGERYQKLKGRYEALSAELALSSKKKLIPALLPVRMDNLQGVIDDLAREVAGNGLAESISGVEDRIVEAVRSDMRRVMSDALGLVGRATPFGAPSQYREKTICTYFGYVSFDCAYYAPDPSRMCRQMRRRLDRERAKGMKRLDKDGDYPRKGGADCAYPALAALGERDGMTPSFADAMQRMGVVAGSFAEGSAMIKLMLGVDMPTSTFRRKMLLAGERAARDQEFPLFRILSPYFPAWLLASTTETTPTMYIMMDGTGVPCVEKDTKNSKGRGPDGRAGTREVKVGIVGTYRRLDKKGRPVRDPGCETHIVSAKTASEFGVLLRRHANSRGYGKAGLRVQIIGDGADWIIGIVRNAFPDSSVIFTNDFYHACEYLHSFISMVEQPERVEKAYHTAKSTLKRRGADKLLRHLRNKYSHIAPGSEAWSKIEYIEKRTEYMRYGEFIERGLFIGSGPVEAACRTDVVRRCKQAGMHWRLKNAAAMSALVARFRSHLPAA